MTTNLDLPPGAFAAALADLPGIGPTRLAAMLRQGPPADIWQQVVEGHFRRRSSAARPVADESPSADRSEWATAAARMDVGRRWESIRAAGISVHFLGGSGMPPALAEDPEPPGVLFCRGSLDVLTRPCVAVVGTRGCTDYGRSVARRLGHDLAAAGVCVVSGLALGIDGAAHKGALRAEEGAGPLGIAPSGVDVPYPPLHTHLWGEVARVGAILSETPPGRQAQAWRFPSRNRLIAAVAQAVVVVESHAGGGSMLTVAAAAARGVEVLAVPGPVTSDSSVGTNQLLYEGAAPARHAGDVLAALGDFRPWPFPPAAAARDSVADRRRPRRPAPAPPPRPRSSGGRNPAGRPTRPEAGGVAAQPELMARGGQPSASVGGRSPGTARLEPALRRVLEAVDWTPTATSVIATRTGLPLGSLSMVLIRLEAASLVRGKGTWWERIAR